MRKILLPVLLAAVFLVTNSAGAFNEASLEYHNSILQSGMYDVVVVQSGTHGKVAFCATYNGLTVLDVNDPGNSFQISKLDLFPDGQFMDLKVQGDYVYLASFIDSALYVVDASDISALSIAGSYKTSGMCYGVDVAGDFAYVTSGGDLVILKVDEPENISFVAEFPMIHNVYNVRVDGDYAYVASGGQLWAVCIEDPWNPYKSGSFYTSEWVDYMPFEMDLVSGDTLLYVAERSAFSISSISALTVVNISDPENMSVVGRATFNMGDVGDVKISGSVACVSNGSNGLQVVDISDPTNPDNIGNYGIAGFVRKVAILGQTAFVVNEYNYGSGISTENNLSLGTQSSDVFQLVDLSEPASPHAIGSYSMPGKVAGVVRSGDYVYAFNDIVSNIAVRVVDISSGGDSAIVCTYATTSGTTAWEGLVVDTLLYIVGSEGIEIVSIADPTDLRFVGSVSYPDATGIVVKGDCAFVSAISFAGVFDISDPANIRLVESISFPGNAVDVVMYGNYVYIPLTNLPNPSQVAIVNISDPENPDYIGDFVSGEPIYNGIATSGSLLYVKKITGFDIFDVRTNPENPQYRGKYIYDVDNAGSRDIFAYGEYVIISVGYDGVRIVDVSDVENPLEVCKYNTSGSALSIFIDENTFCIADEWSLTFFGHTIPTDVGDPDSNGLPKIFVLGQNYPNPFNPSTKISFTLPRGTDVRLTVFNVLGQKVITLVDGFMSPGEHTILWNVTGKCSGIYFYSLHTADFVDTKKMVLVK